MRHLKRVFVVAICCLLPFGRAQADDDTDNAAAEAKIEAAAVNLGRPVEFGRDIMPILKAKCLACHNATNMESGLILESVESVSKGGERGAAVLPKEPDKSLVFQVASRSVEPPMPPLPNDVQAEPLTPQELGLLRQWIAEGAAAGGSASQQVRWQPVPSGLNAIYSVAVSPWGRWAATGRANHITVYDLLTGQVGAELVDPALQSIATDGKPMYGAGAAHRDFVHALAFSPDGSTLASAGYRVVKLWQRPENPRSLQATLPEAMTAAAVSVSGQWAAVGLADNSIRLLSLADGKEAKTFSGHTSAVTGLCFQPVSGDQAADHLRVVSCSLDKTIRVWNVGDGSPAGRVETPTPVNSVVLSKDAARVVSAGSDNVIRVWNVADIVAPAGQAAAAPAADGQAPVKPLMEMKGHEKPITALGLILPEGAQILSGSEDGTVRVWDLSTGGQVRSLDHGGPVTALSVRADGQMAASAGMNHVARLWQLSDGKQVAELKGNLLAERRVSLVTETQTVANQKIAHADAAVKAAESNQKDRDETAKKATDAKAAADKALDEARQKEKAETEKLAAAKAELAKAQDNQDLQKKVAEAEKTAAAATEAVKQAVDAQTTATRSQQLSEKAVEAAKQRLEMAHASKTQAEEHRKQVDAQLTDAQAARTAAELPIRAVVFSNDSTTLATAGDDGIVHVWDTATGRALETLVGHTGPVVALAFGGGTALVSASADKSLAVWDTHPGWKLVGQLGPAGGDPLDVSGSAFVSRVLSLDFSPDGKLLATGGGEPSRSGELMIWDVASRSLVRNITDAHSDTVLGIEFSRDGNYLLSGAADKFVKIFEVATGKHVRSFEGHTHHVLDVGWKADGTLIVSAGADNAIKIWNVETGEQQRTISNYQKQVTAVAFVGVGENILSCGGDKTVRLHRATDGQNYRTFSGGTDFMYSAAATRDEVTVVAGGEDGVLRVWNGQNGQVLRTHEPPQPSQ